MIVTIDGPAGSGKSSSARILASRLGFRFLDTGAMYRIVALACLKEGLDLNDAEAVGDLAVDIQIGIESGRFLLDGSDVTSKIRTEEVTRTASLVALNPLVRNALALRQREIARKGNIVTEGRDQGTFVFPHAECKFFLTANARERAKRRKQELEEAGEQVDLEDLVKQIEERDRRDAGRAVAPLIPADDAVRIDTTSFSQTEVVEKMEQIVRSFLKIQTK